MMPQIKWNWKSSSPKGFTLIELLVACAILGFILIVMMMMINQTSNLWRSTSSKIEAFQSARRSFDVLTSTLSQATLNTYWGYDDSANPSKFVRKSELHFVVAPNGNGMPGTSGNGQGVYFQALAGQMKNSAYSNLVGLLNRCGFYVNYGSDAGWLPSDPIQVKARERYRLMFWLQNSDQSPIFTQADDTSDATSWIAPSNANSYPLADNIIALIIWPRDQTRSATLNSYSYNSRTKQTADPQPATANQLPPVLEVTMVAIDEVSAGRMGSDLQPTIADCLNGLFLSDPHVNFKSDLKKLETRLAAKSINYRVFSASLPVRESRWSPSI